jgi:hypothetical protein
MMLAGIKGAIVLLIEMAPAQLTASKIHPSITNKIKDSTFKM